MRKIVMFILALAMLLTAAPVNVLAAHDDSPELAAANMLNKLGLFLGSGTDEAGNPDYDLDRVPTRYEGVTMLVRLLGKEAEAKAGIWETPFTDVAGWAIPYVGYAYANGLTSGTGEYTFGGTDKITSAQYLTLLLRALGYSSDSDFKWDAPWGPADSLGITDGEYGGGNSKEAFSRGKVALTSLSALSAEEKSAGAPLIESLVKSRAVSELEAIVSGLYDVGETVSVVIGRTVTDTSPYDDMNKLPYTMRICVREDFQEAFPGVKAFDFDFYSPDERMDNYIMRSGYFTQYVAHGINYNKPLRSMLSVGEPGFIEYNCLFLLFGDTRRIIGISTGNLQQNADKSITLEMRRCNYDITDLINEALVKREAAFPANPEEMRLHEAGAVTYSDRTYSAISNGYIYTVDPKFIPDNAVYMISQISQRGYYTGSPPPLETLITQAYSSWWHFMIYGASSYYEIVDKSIIFNFSAVVPNPLCRYTVFYDADYNFLGYIETLIS